jgi:SAM-dependent methyltransferase
VSLPGLLDGLPATDDGVLLLTSDRAFGHGEDGAGEAAYAEQFVVDTEYESALGDGLGRVLDEVRADRRRPALEIGCGTGILTRPLVRRGDYPTYVVTDASLAFVRHVRGSVGTTGSDVRYVVVDGGATDRLPARSFSLVAVRYVLHHILDWEAFLTSAAALLAPGGVLLLEEPVADGFLLQMMLANQLKAAGDLPAEVEKELDDFVGLTTWYLRRGVDKTLSEDKHLFALDEMRRWATTQGLETHVWRNLGLEELGGEARPRADYFAREFRHNLAVNFGFSEATLAAFDERVAPALEQLELVGGHDLGPTVKAVFAFRLPRHRPLGSRVRVAGAAARRRTETRLRAVPGLVPAARLARRVTRRLRPPA